MSGHIGLERPLLTGNETAPFSSYYSGSYRYSFAGSTASNYRNYIQLDLESANAVYGADTIRPESNYSLIIIKE